MTSPCLAGVFLTVCTYEGPQLIYHYYDSSVTLKYEDSDNPSDDGIVWSGEDSSSEEDEFPVNSPALHPIDAENTYSSQGRRDINTRARSDSLALSRARARSRSPASSRSRSRSRSRARGTNTSPSLRPERLAPSVGSTEQRSDVIDLKNNGSPSLQPQQGGANSLTPQGGVTPPPLSTLSKPESSRGGGVLRNFASALGGPLTSDVASETESVASGSHSQQNAAKEYRAELPSDFDAETLAELLTPPEPMCNEKFAVSVDDCIFVGIPVHILESGTWRPLRRDVKDVESRVSGAHSESNAGNTKANDNDDDTDDNHDDSDDNSDDSDIDPRDQSSKLKGVTTDKDSPMRMFHVSFVLKPPITEANACEEQFFHYILVPFIRMLRQEQASKNYVWQEVKKMLAACDALSNASPQDKQDAMETASELARALRQMLDALSRSEIARILINNKVRAFQIPLQLELPQLPNCFDETSPHSYLSTTNLPTKEIGHSCYECYGLLLLDNPEVIVQEIEVDSQGLVAAMIRNIDPTLSLEELARQNNIDIKQIVSLVWSLVYWRRARIIIPVHARHTYCVSPLAPMNERFFELAQAYHQLFPMMPPMQKVLALLSTGRPRPFAMHIPSADHRHIYMRAISWLLQKDLVVQLPTFALIVVTRKIKISSMNTEETLESNFASIEKPETVVTPEDPAKGEQDAAAATLGTKPLKAADSSAEQFRQRRWMSRRRPSGNGGLELEDIEDSVIRDPRKVTALEKRWLGQVAVSGLTRNPDLAALFQRLTKYFNGQDCLEQVMIRERISREEMRKFLHEFNQYIVTYKHW